MLPRDNTSVLRFAALDLGSMHDPAIASIKRVATVHGATIVPQHEVAFTPTMVPTEFFACAGLPDCVEEPLGFFNLESLDVGVLAPAEIDRRSVSFRMNMNCRMPGAWACT